MLLITFLTVDYTDGFDSGYCLEREIVEMAQLDSDYFNA